MNDVFISYCSEDRETARTIAAELVQRGLTVWWDRVIPPGRQYDEVIEENLAGARCVVVLWSTASAASKWVKIEAGEALRQDRLVPALVESGVRIPLEFSRVQAADLTAWQPGQHADAFEQFFAAVSGGSTPGPVPVPPPKPPTPAPAPGPGPGPQGWGRKQWTWIGVAVLVVGGLSQLPSAPDPQPAAPNPGPSVRPGQGALTPPAELFGGGIDAPVQFRDHILSYNGKLAWDGRTTLGTLSFTARDQGNGRIVAQGDYQALLLQVNPQRIRFHMQLALAGDSHTSGPHSHDINLLYDRQPDGRWRFVQNCPGPSTCY